MSLMLSLAMALFTDGFLYGLVIPLLPQISQNTFETWMFGVISACYACGVILAIPFFSSFSDRVGRRKPFLYGSLAQIFSILLFALPGSFPIVALARFAQGLASATTWTIGLALVAENFQMNRAKMIGYVMLANTLGQILGPGIGASLCESYGHSIAFAVIAFLSILDCILRFYKVEDGVQRAKKKGELKALLLDSSVLMSCMIIVLGAWCWSILESLLPSHLENVTNISSSTVGMLFTVSSFVYAFACPFVGACTDRYGASVLMNSGLIAMAFLLPSMAMPTDPLTVGMLLSFISLAYGFTMDPALSELGAAVERLGNGAYALVYGVYNIAYSIGMISSDLSSGILTSAYSFQTALIVTASVMLSCLALRKFSRIRKWNFLESPESLRIKASGELRAFPSTDHIRKAEASMEA